MSQSFYVRWHTYVYADTHEEAALKARKLQRLFIVRDAEGPERVICLPDDEAEEST